MAWLVWAVISGWGIEFVPRRGETVVWSNVDIKTGQVDHDMIRQGMPTEETFEKMVIILWVRDEPLTSPQ